MASPTFALTDILIGGWQTSSQIIVSGVPSHRDKEYKGRLIAGYHKDSRLDTLCSELNELKVLLQGQANPEQPEDVNVLSSAQSAPRWSTPKGLQPCSSCPGHRA